MSATNDQDETKFGEVQADEVVAHYDEDRKVLVLEIPYDCRGEYELGESRATYRIAPNLKFNVEADTGLNINEHFFVTLGIYRYVNPPRQRKPRQ